MENDSLPPKYDVANGPEGLGELLAQYHLNAQSKNDSLQDERYILYQLNHQKVLIKIDMSVMPYQFWCYDLLGRPATNPIKEAIAQFLWVTCNERAKYLGGNVQ